MDIARQWTIDMLWKKEPMGHVTGRWVSGGRARQRQRWMCRRGDGREVV